MEARKDETFELKAADDIVRIRQLARTWAMTIGFSLTDQTRIVTAASELARNTIQYGGGGSVRFRWLLNDKSSGLRLDFVDTGPGIPDVALAMNDGYSTSGGLGLGLSGSKRLMSEFEIDSTPGKGTRVSVARWT